MPDEPGTVEAPQQEGQQTEAAPSQVDGATVDRIVSRLDEIGGQVGQLYERIPEQQQEEAPETDEVTAILQQLGYEVPDEAPSPEELDQLDLTPQELVELVVNASRQATQAELQRELHPHLAAQNEQQLEDSFMALEQRYPKLVDDEEWQAKVIDSAEQLAQRTGKAEWLEDPTLLELVHKSLLADELASQETPVTATNEGLENPRGANPSNEDESDQERADRIVQASGEAKLRDAGFFQ